jgi:hypothetical protein
VGVRMCAGVCTLVPGVSSDSSKVRTSIASKGEDRPRRRRRDEGVAGVAADDEGCDGKA